MKRIKVNKEFKILVDDEDLKFLNQNDWRVVKNGNTYYAIKQIGCNNKRKTLYLHRLILNLQHIDGTNLFPEIMVDHINGNGLDNRRNNIRVADKSTNSMNSRKRCNTLNKYKGVYKSKENGRIKKFKAHINVNKKRVSLGCFLTAKDAAIAYNEAAIKYHGNFAKLNKI